MRRYTTRPADCRPIVSNISARGTAGDVLFPHFDLDHWRVVAEERCEADERHSSAFTFQTLERASYGSTATSAEAMANGKLALCVNPMSGRDVRRLAARATNMTHEAKRDIVARVAAGADAVGVKDIYIAKEPFRIAEGALELMKLQAKVHIVDIPTNTAKDTVQAMGRFKSAAVIPWFRWAVMALTELWLVLTATSISYRFLLVPITFSSLNRAHMGGMVASSIRSEKPQICPEPATARQILYLQTPTGTDIGLVDAVLLRRDQVGNMLPFDADRLIACC